MITVSVIDKEVYLTAPIAENKRLTFLALMAALVCVSWNGTVTVSWLLSIPDFDEQSVWSKLSNAALLKFSLTK